MSGINHYNLELWQVLKDGKAGDEFEILSDKDQLIDGRIMKISISPSTGGNYMHFKDNGNLVSLSSYLLKAKFRRVINFVPVWEAIEAYMKGKTIICYSQSANSEFKLYATYKKNDNTHNAISIFEINSYLWMIMED